MKFIKPILFVIILSSATNVLADDISSRLAKGIDCTIEMQATTASGDNNPLWLNANKYGLSSVEKNNGYLRASVVRDKSNDSLRNWAVGYGLDMAVASHFTSKFFVQQAFVEGRYKRGVLTIGSKYHEMNLKNSELSSGSQALGINARPLPEVRIEMPEYWDIPGLKGWLAFRGHIAYGCQTDDNWQKDFTHKEGKFTENTLYHSKSGFLRVAPDDKPLQFELGLEWGCQFGGKSQRLNENGEIEHLSNQQNLESFWHAFFPDFGTVGEIGEGVYANCTGNHVGSWLARLAYKGKGWKIAAYIDHYFEDHSQLLFVDYDGYGTGDEWDEKKDNRFLLYKFKDALLGIEATLPKNPIVSTIVAEHLYTKYQSGPIFHDHTPSMPTHIAGKDNYYNHYVYTGWQHWGQVIGNPLYTSPLYNNDGAIEVKNNRFSAFHCGISGDPTPQLHYRMLATWQKGYGTYQNPFIEPKSNFSFLAEVHYDCSLIDWMKGISVTCAFALDRGKLIGDNTGCQFTIAKRF